MNQRPGFRFGTGIRREWAKPAKGHESDVAGAGPPRNGTSEGTDRDKGAPLKPQEVDRELLAPCRGLGASLRPTPVVRLVHLRLNLFAKLDYNNVVGSLKG